MPTQSLPVLLKNRLFNPYKAIEQIFGELNYMYNYAILDEDDQPWYHKGFTAEIYHQEFVNRFHELAEVHHYAEERIDQMIGDTFEWPYGYK